MTNKYTIWYICNLKHAVSALRHSLLIPSPIGDTHPVIASMKTAVNISRPPVLRTSTAVKC